MMTIRRNACRPLTYLPTSALALIYVSSLSLNILYPCSTCPSVFLFSTTSFFLCSYLLRLTPYIPLRPHLFIALSLSLSLFLSLYLSFSFSLYLSVSFSLSLSFFLLLSLSLSLSNYLSPSPSLCHNYLATNYLSLSSTHSLLIFKAPC